MTKEEKTVFTRRIAEANRSELILVLYDIFFSYEKEALALMEEGETYGGEEKRKVSAQAGEAVHRAGEVLTHLEGDLNFSYAIAKDLYMLYDYCSRLLTEGLVRMDPACLREADWIMTSLKEAFTETAKTDTSAPLMQHTQKVMAGVTYGRKSLTESLENDDASRGFLA